MKPWKFMDTASVPGSDKQIRLFRRGAGYVLKMVSAGCSRSACTVLKEIVNTAACVPEPAA
jgi:hypothetical protein